MSSGPANRDGATRRRWLATALGLAGAGAIPFGSPGSAFAQDADERSALERIRERGSLVVAVYNDLPPFHVKGAGIEVDLAEALARSLGLRLSLMPFNAGEDMGDDLRNMVWRGHYLGFGPADVLLHVPVDRPLIQATPQATLFGAYYRERVAIARRVDRVPALDTLQPLAEHRTAVPGQSLAGWLLIGADAGAYRDHLDTKWVDGTEAAKALLEGQVDIAAGVQSELESVVGRNPAFAIEPLPSPRAPSNGWAVGCAVKREASDLAAALQKAIEDLTTPEGLGTMFEKGGITWHRA